MSDLLLAAWLAGIYARVSKDTRKGSGRARASVNQQVSEARDDISDLGTYEGRPILLKETYQRDNDVSASPFATKVREDWPRFVEDVENKRINFVVLWECSRGSREGVEWLTFLSLCRSLSVPIRVVTHGRTYDVRNPRDWKTLADEGIDAEVESAKTSIRVLRDKKDTRQSGRPDGPLCYGHKREYDPDTGELLRQVPEPVESRVVIEIFEEFVGGKPLTAIMRELNERIDLPLEDPRRVPRLRRGAKWSTEALRRTLKNPAHIGKRRDPHTGELLDTQWAPLSESLPVLYWAAQRIMKERATAVQSPGKAKHLLTRIMTCGVCGATLAQHRIKGRPRYHCSGIDAQGVATGRNGCVSVSQEHMDDYITNLVVHRLSQPDLLAQAAVQDDAVIVLAQAEAEALRAKLDEAYAGYKRDVLTLDQYAERKLDLMARIEAAEAAVRNLGIPPMLRAFTGLIGANNNTQAEALVREMWKGFPVAGRRDIIRALFSKLSLRAGVPGGQVFNPDRLERTWRKWSDALDE
ncbi:recombinase family protein [Glycomyces lechevalierae]|uniref:DNA invertase Pin-like site-specific DNA recombinase n=3 Tax=Glycomyces TaxID=58113 RepID=A0ABU2AL97_9ACTN|nr:recombinase family protein [Glycomyces lechevalierae]MDR7336768.1 DNA invertase Pin-like site-specific DNA recombinase [Glycomyces lechevalierae]